MIGIVTKTANYFNPRAPCGARLVGRAVCDEQERNFNPRAPCGARLLVVSIGIKVFKFQPTRPLRGATSVLYIGLVRI